MNNVYLDCSGLHNISVDGDNIPRSIYVDGQDFLARLSQTLQESSYVSESELKKKERWDLIVALASNPVIFNPNVLISNNHITNAKILIDQADAIIKALEERLK